jgi:hypothetical protein
MRSSDAQTVGDDHRERGGMALAVPDVPADRGRSIRVHARAEPEPPKPVTST